jgi:hypothetical protein
VRAHALAHPALHFQNLLPGLDQGFLEASDFFRQFHFRNLAFGNGWPAAPDEEDFAAANAARNRDAPESLFSLMVGLWHERLLAQAQRFGKQESDGGSLSQAHLNPAT